MAASKRKVTASSTPAKKATRARRSGAAKSLAERLLLKPGQQAHLLHAPADQVKLFAAVATAERPSGASAVVVWAASQKELAARLPKAGKACGEGARLWVCYPKAGQLGTDLSRDVLHDLLPAHGWDAIRQIALDEVWSALASKRKE